MRIENVLKELQDRGLTVVQEDGIYSAYTDNSTHYIRFNTVTHANGVGVHKKIDGRTHTKQDSLWTCVEGMVMDADVKDMTQAINYVLCGKLPNMVEI